MILSLSCLVTLSYKKRARTEAKKREKKKMAQKKKELVSVLLQTQEMGAAREEGEDGEHGKERLWRGGRVSKRPP